jgi:uncharacterized membrane protein
MCVVNALASRASNRNSSFMIGMMAHHAFGVAVVAASSVRVLARLIQGFARMKSPVAMPQQPWQSRIEG